MPELRGAPAGRRSPAGTLAAVVIALFVVAIAAIGVWGLAVTSTIDATPLGTAGPPGPDAIPPKGPPQAQTDRTTPRAENPVATER